MKDTVLDVTQYNSTVDESASVPDTSSASPLLTVSMASGRKLVARVVVAAMGPTTVPRIPSWAQGLETECSSKGDSGYRRIRHAWDLIRGSAATGVRTSEDQAAVVDPSSASDPGRSAGKVSAKSKALARKARRKRTLADNRAGTRLKRRQVCSFAKKGSTSLPLFLNTMWSCGIGRLFLCNAACVHDIAGTSGVDAGKLSM